MQIIREISRKVSQIQNRKYCHSKCIRIVYSFFVTSTAGLGEFRIRDLNDEINKLIREKSHWQERIRELGGPDYFVRESFMICLCLINFVAVFLTESWPSYVGSRGKGVAREQRIQVRKMN